MAFLAPLWLMIAGAAAVPLLLHLMRRRSGVRVLFPAMRYLARAEQEHSRKLRLRNLLLMLLRVLALLLVAAAAARPVARLGGAGHAPTALVIVVDNSASSGAVAGGAPVLLRLKASAERVLSATTPGDRLWLVTADARARGGSRDELRAVLRAIAPLDGAGDPSAALRRARQLGAGSGLTERRIALFTDAQASSWADAVSTPARDTPIALVTDAARPPADNAVLDLDASPARWTPRGALLAQLRLAVDSAVYRVRIGERTIARGTAVRAGAAGGGADDAASAVRIDAGARERGWLRAQVELPPDEWRTGDVRHVAFWAGDPPSVAVDAVAVGAFAVSAIDALRAASRVATSTGTTATRLTSADRYTGGRALLVPPLDPVRLGAANRALERADIPWRYGPLRTSVAPLRARPGLDMPLTGAESRRRYVLQPVNATATADTLIDAAGEPWAIATGDVVLLASPLLPDATTLPLRAAFAPLLDALLSQWLGGGAGTVIDAAPGAPVILPPWATALEPPSGAHLVLPIHERHSAPSRSGVYFLLRGGARAGALVVNPEADELVLARLTGSELARRIGASAVTTTGDDDVAAVVFAGASRRPLVVPLLLLALVALMAEAVIAGRGASARGASAADRPAARSAA